MDNNWESNRINFYDNIYKNPNNHWRKKLNFKFDNLFTQIILGNLKKDHKTMLEVGTDGRFFETFLKNNNHNLNISVIDISSKAIEIINNKFKNINTFCEDFFVFADSRVSKNEKFDIIYSNGTHEHFRELEKSLKLTKQLLSKNGFFLMAVPNNLGYDINKDQQVEGFRELNGGSRQMEWHLFLNSWKKIIYNSGFKFTFFRGFDERIGFIFYMYT